MEKKWLQPAIKYKSHPVIRAAKEKGISTLQEATNESHSPDAHIRDRGMLGVRLSRRKI